jgi:16S rRNA (guanine527-N7)-methyltransferase
VKRGGSEQRRRLLELAGGDAAAADALGVLVVCLADARLNVTAIGSADEAIERHAADALRALPLVDALPPGPLADVGSGGGVPGLALAAVRPARSFTLIEATARKAAFIEETAAAMGVAVEVIAGRSEELARGPLRDAFAGVLARALAPPPVAAELCLPLCQVGGRVLLWVGEGAGRAGVEAASDELGGRLLSLEPGGLAVVEKVAPTPARFPRRPGMAAKRPLARP